jgi:hypothetical protein
VEDSNAQFPAPSLQHQGLPAGKIHLEIRSSDISNSDMQSCRALEYRHVKLQRFRTSYMHSSSIQICREAELQRMLKILEFNLACMRRFVLTITGASVATILVLKEGLAPTRCPVMMFQIKV